MKVTAKTIAQHLNISPATVDRVFNNRGNVSEKTVKKVLAKADELNYRPNKSASFLSKKKNLRIAYVIPTYPVYFWKEIEFGIKNALEDIQDYGFGIEIYKVPYKTKDQINVVKEIVQSQSFDGMIICPTDDLSLTELINAEIEKGFPIYTFNNDSPSSKRLSYVGADYHDAGGLAGELLNHFTKQSKNLAIIVDEVSTFQMKKKSKGFKEFIKHYNDLNSLNTIKIYDKNVEKSLTHLESTVHNFDGIYVASGVLADVAEQIKTFNLTKPPILIGHDMNSEIYQLLQEDMITATICQNPVYQGSLSVRLAFNHLMLEKGIEKKENIVKLEIVTKGNSKYYYN